MSFRSIAVAALCVSVLLVSIALWSLFDGVAPAQGHPHDPDGSGGRPLDPAPTPTPTPEPARPPRSDTAAPFQKTGSSETQPTTQDKINEPGMFTLTVVPTMADRNTGGAAASVREFHATPVPNGLRSRFSDSAPVPAGILKTVRETGIDHALARDGAAGIVNLGIEPTRPPGPTDRQSPSLRLMGHSV